MFSHSTTIETGTGSTAQQVTNRLRPRGLVGGDRLAAPPPSVRLHEDVDDETPPGNRAQPVPDLNGHPEGAGLLGLAGERSGLHVEVDSGWELAADLPAQRQHATARLHGRPVGTTHLRGSE